MTPRVSVVIPVYNRAAVVARAIESVLEQNFRSFEIIVVDDGSTDDLKTVVAAVGDPRLRVVGHAPNRGAAAARNSGIDASSGEFIAFLDSDDAWHPAKLERQVGAMEGMPFPAATCTGFRLWHGITGTSEVRSSRRSTDWRRALLDGCYVSPGTTLMVHRAAFDAIGRFDVSLRRLEDWDWLLRFVSEGAFSVLPDILAEVHLGGRPRPEIVREATTALWERRSPDIRKQLGVPAMRTLRASLMIEEAVSQFHHGSYLAAVASGAKAASQNPARLARFISTFVMRRSRRMFTTQRP